MNIQDIPPHITLEYIASRCRECPACGKQSEWQSGNRNRGPTLDMAINGRRKKIYVRRLVWRLAHPTGKMPNGKTMVITSKCTNPFCVDPGSIYATSRAQAWKSHAARGTWGGPAASAAAIRGAKSRRKLSDEGVIDITTSGGTATAAAKKWGVSITYVLWLRSGRYRRDTTVTINPFAGPAGLLR